ncbi:MAG TPA: YhcN/YlaJ family sporulation lipoprotein [Paenibacillus sp.]|uniref:YhcN/YlaJ family sporulation lipoprotein n=1 Tax=Paenibacillus sp. TaxID=58172 RepID=UPI002C0425D0|nr:YhcN/YlaJ family sporulation lipoprotein [Paenibacillus sp.]HUC94250.1 YhcN/YlaJ family sporulation lipoprotein [Paenibacillus sp.]
MKRAAMIGTACFLIACLLSGCSGTQGDVGNKNIRPQAAGQDGSGNKIIDKRFADDVRNEQNRENGKRLNSNNLIGDHRNYRMEMSREIADRLNELKGVEASYVVLTDRNAYVAVRMDGADGAGADEEAFKRRIADRVKTMAPHTEQVFVSANPEFVDRMGGYKAQVDEGLPIQGLIAEFNGMVERMFPVDSGLRYSHGTRALYD